MFKRYFIQDDSFKMAEPVFNINIFQIHSLFLGLYSFVDLVIILLLFYAIELIAVVSEIRVRVVLYYL